MVSGRPPTPTPTGCNCDTCVHAYHTHVLLGASRFYATLLYLQSARLAYSVVMMYQNLLSFLSLLLKFLLFIDATLPIAKW